MKKLSRSYFKDQDVLFVAKDLLGKTIRHQSPEGTYLAKIVETEAYRAPEDKACHAYNNLKTKRTEVMFLPGGVAYIYLCYGIHHLFNVVTGAEHNAQAVLIRAVEPLEGIHRMCVNRNFPKRKFDLTNGPGKWTQAMRISTALNGYSIVGDILSIWEDESNPTHEIEQSNRIGIDYAEECRDWPWRFHLKHSNYISRR